MTTTKSESKIAPLQSSINIVPLDQVRASVACPGCHLLHDSDPSTCLVIVNTDRRPFCESCAGRMIESLIAENDDGALDALMRMLAPAMSYVTKLERRPAIDLGELQASRSEMLADHADEMIPIVQDGRERIEKTLKERSET